MTIDPSETAILFHTRSNRALDLLSDHTRLRELVTETADGVAPYPREAMEKDIAYHLAAQARFNGATSVPYCVALHSLCVMLLVAGSQATTAERTGDAFPLDVPEIRAALWHDAAEAFLGDLVAPLKRCAEFASFRVLDDQWTTALFTHVFGLAGRFPLSPRIVGADRDMRALEQLIFQVRPNLPNGPANPDMDIWLRRANRQYGSAVVSHIVDMLTTSDPGRLLGPYWSWQMQSADRILLDPSDAPRLASLSTLLKLLWS